MCIRDSDRRQAYGRWSEFVGSGGVESDKMMRRFQIKSSAETDYEALNVETREMLEAYSSGEMHLSNLQKVFLLNTH